MTILRALKEYKDDRGNEIRFDGNIESDVRIVFTGSNNKLTVGPDVRIEHFNVSFDCDNGNFTIGGNDGKAPGFGCNARVGQDATVLIGRNVSSTTPVMISCVEGTTIKIGNDVMFAAGNELRGDDAHPIFDVQSGARVNPAKPITIGDHVWVGGRAALLGGASIGNGSVVGYASIVKKVVPNNCVVVGNPGRVVKRNIAWERPHLSLTKPYYKPHSSTVTKSGFWSMTEPEDGAPLISKSNFKARLKRAVAAF